MKVIMKTLLSTTVLPKLEGDRKIQAKEKAEEREGTNLSPMKDQEDIFQGRTRRD